MECVTNDVAANDLARTSLGWDAYLAKPGIQGATMPATARPGVCRGRHGGSGLLKSLANPRVALLREWLCVFRVVKK
jgi:hypothetical protein